MRDVIVAANWKMHTTPADAGELARTIAARTRVPGVIRVICPPFVCLAAVRDALAETDPDVAVGAQNVHHELQGAYTGEISAPMLAGLATWVIVGHSERRRDAGETDELIGRKLGAGGRRRPAADPVRRASSSRTARRAARTRSSERQLRGRPRRPRRRRARRGRPGHRLRAGLGDRHGGTPAARTRPRWPRRSGASLGRLGWARTRPTTSRSSTAAASPSANIGEFLAEPAIDGALVGGASLKPDEMAGIVARAGLTAARTPRRGVTGATALGRPRPIVLVVLDGFGIGRDPAADAIAAAPMPIWRGLLARWPHAHARASEDAVGLPPGQMGNSEVGHLNLGAGRPVLQDLPADRRGHRRRLVLRATGAARGVRPRRATPDGRLHLVSLVGPGRRPRQRPPPRRPRRAGGADAASRDVRVHALLDGRDTPPSSALGFVARPRGAASPTAHPDARDRVGRRPLLRDGPRPALGPRRARLRRDRPRGGRARRRRATAAIEAAYARGENDEFVGPTVIDGVDGRGPRRRRRHPRQLPGRPRAPADPRARRRRRSPASTGPRPTAVRRRRDLLVVTMTEYEAGLPVEVAFPPEEARSLAEAFSEAGWRQFHVAETEKYAHVTYFFNGGVEAPLPGEDRRLSRARRSRPTTSQPEMSAAGVTDALVEAIAVGRATTSSSPTTRTRTWSATPASGTRPIAALEVVDGCLGRIVGGDRGASTRATRTGPAPLLAITADHGNADEMRDADGHAGHRPLAQPGAVRARRSRGARACTLARRRPRRRRADAARARRACRAGTGMTGRSPDPVIASVAVAVTEEPRPVNPLLAIGQILVSIALIVAILLQARGIGPVRHVRRRLGRLPQPSRRRAPALAVHDRPARPVRRLLPGRVRPRPGRHRRLTRLAATRRRPDPHSESR